MEKTNTQANPFSPMGLESAPNKVEAVGKRTKEDPVLVKVNEEIGGALRTLRMLEERYITLRKRSQISDQNIIEDTNKIFTQLKLINNDIEELKVSIEEMKEKLELFAGEIKGMASRQELTVLQRYVDMWQPMSFLTEKDALKMIKEALDSKKD